MIDKSERIDEILNLINKDVGRIEDKADWLERMKLLSLTALVLAMEDQTAAQFISGILASWQHFAERAGATAVVITPDEMRLTRAYREAGERARVEAFRALETITD